MFLNMFLITHLLRIKKRQMPGANFSCDLERRALSLFDSLWKENNAIELFLVNHVLLPQIHIDDVRIMVGKFHEIVVHYAVKDLDFSTIFRIIYEAMVDCADLTVRPLPAAFL